MMARVVAVTALASLVAGVAPTRQWWPGAARPQRVARGMQGGGAAVQAPRAARERAVPFRVGETLSYEIAWASLLTAANATVTVREKRPSFDAVAWYIVAEGRPSALLAALYPLYYKADALVDTVTLLSQRGSLFSREGDRQRLREMRFDRGTRLLKYQVLGGEPLARLSGEDLAVPPTTQDPLTALFVMRAIPFDRTPTVTMPIAMNGRTQQYTITRVAREPVTSGLGTLPALKLMVKAGDEAAAEVRGVALWISDDERRLPLRLEAELPVGAFVLTLRDATR
jgi:hypothetical protein